VFIGEVDDALIGVLPSVTLSPDHHINKLLEPLIVLIGFEQIAVAAVNLPTVGTRALLALLLKVSSPLGEYPLVLSFGMGVKGSIGQVALSTATDIIPLVGVLLQPSLPFLPKLLGILTVFKLVSVFIELIIRLNNNLIFIGILTQSPMDPLLFSHLIINYNVSIL
jgi:hypothetical protein